MKSRNDLLPRFPGVPFLSCEIFSQCYTSPDHHLLSRLSKFNQTFLPCAQPTRWKNSNISNPDWSVKKSYQELNILLKHMKTGDVNPTNHKHEFLRGQNPQR